MTDAHALRALLGMIGNQLRKPAERTAQDKLLAEAEDTLQDLGIRCGLLLPPRTIALSDLVAGKEPEVGTMDRMAAALMKLVGDFRAYGAPTEAIIEALTREAEALEAEADAEWIGQAEAAPTQGAKK